MNKITTKKIQQINEILKEAKIPMSFSFVCCDFKVYKPKLTFITTIDSPQWLGKLGTYVTKNNIVQFYFKIYPQLPIVESYEDHAENFKQMQKWDKVIDSLNALKLQVPKYE